MGRFCRLINDLSIKKVPLVGRKFTWSSSVSGSSRLWSSWTRCFARWSGKTSSQIASSKVLLLMTLIIAPLSWDWLMFTRERKDFALNVSGRSFRASRRRFKLRGVRFSLQGAPWRLFPSRSKLPRKVCRVGVIKKLGTSDGS
jgi:hypothetical protein